MKAKELASLKVEELLAKKKELEEQLLEAKFSASIKRPENPKKIRNLRKELARVLTFLRHHERKA
jgi:large subunit ribosomal protein L29